MTPEARKIWNELRGVRKPDRPTQSTGDNPSWEHYEQWYVYVPGPGPYSEGDGYLHNDGKIYENASGYGRDKRHIGWFETEEDALAAIALYYNLLGY